MTIRDLFLCYQELEGQEVTIKGWVRNKRVGKNIGFINLNDGTIFETVQIVYKELSNKEEINSNHLGSALEILGVIKITENKNNGFEIEAKDIKILAKSEENYPLQPKKHSYEFLREIAHLRPRTNTFHAVFKIRSLLSFAVHSFFREQDFLYVHTPIITGLDAEGAGETFQVTNLDLNNLPLKNKQEIDYKEDFFGKEVSLTVSGQLLAESYALAFSNVYTFGPTFRAEDSNTTRHAAEFWMIEPEMSFADLDDNIKVAKKLLVYVINYVLEHAISELEFLNNLVEYDLIKRLKDLIAGDFIEIEYEQAIDILQKAIENGKKFDNKVEYGIDLATEHEKYLTNEKFKAPVFVKNYPKEIKAFYMRLNDDNTTVAAMDLLVPGIGELIGGSQREERIDKLDEVMKKHNLSNIEYNWYKDLRKYGGVQHSGFGIGFERLIMYVTGIENIRDVIPFPRTTNNCDF